MNKKFIIKVYGIDEVELEDLERNLEIQLAMAEIRKYKIKVI